MSPLKLPPILERLDPKQKRMFLAAAAGVAVLLWIWLVLFPQWRVIAEVRPKSRELKSQIEETRRGIAQMPELNKKYEDLRTSLRAHPKQLVQERLPELLDEIAALAKSNGVLVQTVRPVEARDRKEGTGKEKAETPRAESAVIAIEILGQAGYHDVGRFVDALEQSPQLFQIRRLTMTGDRRDEVHHRISMTVDAIVAVTPL
ncbi:MAG: type 4a pilus biogenesis protein PilO [Candidatus Omnitrophica bacterium]|nr:type 4a pilus biogenesis protein PilO [Candidatus Omnitrophota bacterium]